MREPEELDDDDEEMEQDSKKAFNILILQLIAALEDLENKKRSFSVFKYVQRTRFYLYQIPCQQANKYL